MALFKYFKKADCGNNSLEAKVAGDKEEVSEVKKARRGEYTRLSQEDKAAIGRYACENGVSRALAWYRDKNVKRSSVSDWKRAYEKELQAKSKDTEPGKAVMVEALPLKNRGRPPLLGHKMDKALQNYIIGMRSRGTPIGTTVVVGIGRGLILKDQKTHPEYFINPDVLTRDWARSVLRRMGYSKRRSSTTSKVLPGNFDDIKGQYLSDIQCVVEMEEIPDDMILNWDQTAIKIVPSSSWTMEKRGCKRVKIVAVDDKRQITAVFACSVTGSFLPIQLIYQGTTDRCLPCVQFPSDWHITCTANHWSTEVTMMDYIKKIIVPFMVEKRKVLKLPSDHPGLVVFDVFKGQCTEAVFNLLEENNILRVMVPPNCTDQLQPLDLSVNKAAKDYMRSRFQEWYGSIIHKQLEEQKEEAVDLRLSIMKPLSAQWIVQFYHYIASKQEIIKNGFHAAGIIDSLKKSSK